MTDEGNDAPEEKKPEGKMTFRMGGSGELTAGSLADLLAERRRREEQGDESVFSEEKKAALDKVRRLCELYGLTYNQLKSHLAVEPRKRRKKRKVEE